MSEARAWIGLDIGGHGIKGCRLEADGQISSRFALRTPIEEGASSILRAADEVLGRLLEQGPVGAVGIGTPGAVDEEGRIAAEAVNIPGWRGQSSARPRLQRPALRPLCATTATSPPTRSGRCGAANPGPSFSWAWGQG